MIIYPVSKMELLCYFLGLSLSVLYNPQPATGQGVTLELNGIAVPNFGLLAHSDIDSNDNPAVGGGNLVCRTDSTSCCRYVDTPAGTGGFGDWFYPGGDVVAFSFESLPNAQIYRQLRGTQVVRLYRNGGPGTTSADGIYRCEVADQNNNIQTRYVGLYANGAEGAVTVGASLQFVLIDPGSFRLFAITSGGPPTTFSWRGPNGLLSNADSTVTVQNSITSTVQLQLRVTGNVPGEYTFTATNSRTAGDVTSTFTVTAGAMPTGLMAVQQGAGIRVTWIAPAPAPTGYVVYYQAGSSGVQTTQTGSTDILLTDNVVNGAQHSIQVAALANIPGERAGPVTVDFLLAPDPPVVTLTDAMATGVTVGWTSQGGVDSYEVLYNRTTGSAQQGACPDFVDMGSATANGGDTSLTLQNIEEFSSYTITVIAMSRIASVGSTAVEFMSPSAASSPPSVALVTSTNTTIAVSWTALRCINQNSQFTIVNYTVRYGRESDSERTQVLVPGTSTVFTVSILEPGTRYSIAVAAVNSNGETGEFSEPIVESTSGGTFSISSSLAAAIVLGAVLLLCLLLNTATICITAVKCRRQGHTTDQQEMTDLSDAKISTAPCEAYIGVPSSAQSGRARQQPQYEDILPATYSK